jgi:hypothetical protein
MPGYSSAGILACGAGDYAQARAHFEQTAVLARALRQPWQIADALTNLAASSACRVTTRRLRLTSARLCRSIRARQPALTADPLCALAENELLQGHLAPRARLQEAAAVMGSSANSWLQILVGYFSGLLAHYEGDAERAAARLEATAALACDNEFKPTARTLIAPGRVRAAQGQAAAATALLQEGLELNRQMRHALGSVTALEGWPHRRAGRTGAGRAARSGRRGCSARPAPPGPAWARLVPPVDRPAHEQTSRPSGRAWTSALAMLWAEGQAMSVAEASLYALQDSPEGEPTPSRPAARVALRTLTPSMTRGRPRWRAGCSTNPAPLSANRVDHRL